MRAASRPNDAHSAANRLIAKDLRLVRGGRELFAGLSFEAESGAFVELRGPNGAGKTSLLRVLAGFLPPSGGTVSFDTPAHYLGHRDGLKRTLDARAHVRFWASLLGGDETGCDAALTRVGLQGDWPVSILSQGQGRRLALARLLAAPRPLWLLDEPGAALDASGRALLTELIAEHRASGGIVVAALHEGLGVEPTNVIRLGQA
jgi:heme exporter protein A